MDRFPDGRKLGASIDRWLRIGPPDLAPRQLFLGLLGAWSLLIASASLYPFDVAWRPLLESLFDGLPRLREWRVPSQRDAIVNLLLYLPFGLLGSMALGVRYAVALRILLPVSGAALFSLGIEIAQHALPPRDPSLADWLLNIASAGCGALLAQVYAALPVRPLARRWQRIAMGPAPVLLVAVWLIAHFAPFVPRLRPGRIESAVETSLALGVAGSWVFYYLAAYVVLATLVHAVLRRRYFWVGLGVLFCGSLAGRVLFVGQHLPPGELVGAALAVGGVALLRHIEQHDWVSRAFVLVLAAVFVGGVCPSFSPEASLVPPAPVWLPFAELADRPGDPGALPVLERLFLGIGLAALAVQNRWLSLPALPVALSLALVAEFLQQWIPGRVPDTTDIAALLIGAALASAAPRVESTG